MKTIDDIIARFDSVTEPAVSAETLGAYIEGNLSEAETLAVEDALDDSPELSYLTSVAIEPEAEIADGFDIDDLPELPTVPGLTEVELVDDEQEAELVAEHEPSAVEAEVPEVEPVDVDADDDALGLSAMAEDDQLPYADDIVDDFMPME